MAQRSGTHTIKAKECPGERRVKHNDVCHRITTKGNTLQSVLCKLYDESEVDKCKKPEYQTFQKKGNMIAERKAKNLFNDLDLVNSLFKQHDRSARKSNILSSNK